MSEGIAVHERRRRTNRSCQHHWLIETPHGATSRGVCKRCGASKRFPNAAEDILLWGSGSVMGRWSSGRDTAKPREITAPRSLEEEE